VGILGVLAVVAAGAIVIQFSHGSFKPYYYLKAEMPRAGQQLELGADVRIRGVKVGRVSGIKLKDGHAVLTLQMEKGYQVPRDAAAIVGIKTLLGEKFVALRFDPGGGGPYLADGGTITNTSVGTELSQVLADGTAVLEAVKPQDAAAIISTLARAVRDEGLTIHRGLRDNAHLSSTFASTTKQQLAALSDFETVFGALKSKGVDLNELARAVNEGVPIYASNAAAASMRKALVALVPFADDLSDLLIVDRAQWDTLIDRGDVVLGAIAAHPQGLRSLVHGLYRYVYKLGGAIDRNLMLDGSAAAGFTNFIGGTSFKESMREVCYALPPDVREGVAACGGKER
jgi:phospholipid/cholesterol/gamma-HCH transport system substrate-binding protein